LKSNEEKKRLDPGLEKVVRKGLFGGSVEEGRRGVFFPKGIGILSKSALKKENFRRRSSFLETKGEERKGASRDIRSRPGNWKKGWGFTKRGTGRSQRGPSWEKR